jgi:Family of unknown function (DUF5677)
VPELTDDEIRMCIIETYGSQLKACRDLLALAHNELGAWSGRAVKRGADRIIVAEAARATKTFDGVVRLCEAGFGEQAAMLNRSLFEAMAIAHWVSDNRRLAVGLFARHSHYNAVLWYETFDRLGWLTEADRVRRPKAGPKKRAEFKKLFGTYGTEPWVKRNLPALLREIEHLWDEPGRGQLWAFHDVPHRHNNQMLHSTATAAGAAHIAATANELRFTIGASNQLVIQALLTGYWTYGQVFSLLIHVFRLASRAEFERLFESGVGALSDGGPLGGAAPVEAG